MQKYFLTFCALALAGQLHAQEPLKTWGGDQGNGT